MMAAKKGVFVGFKPKKGKNRILIHRKTDQFRDFVRLVRESHARVALRTEQPKTAVAVEA